jgi:Ca2+/Na+ antiporter
MPATQRLVTSLNFDAWPRRASASVHSNDENASAFIVGLLIPPWRTSIPDLLETDSPIRKQDNPMLIPANVYCARAKGDCAGARRAQ